MFASEHLDSVWWTDETDSELFEKSLQQCMLQDHCIPTRKHHPSRTDEQWRVNHDLGLDLLPQGLNTVEGINDFQN